MVINQYKSWAQMANPNKNSNFFPNNNKNIKQPRINGKKQEHLKKGPFKLTLHFIYLV